MVDIVIKPEQVIINPTDPEIVAKVQAKNFFEKIIYKTSSKFQKINIVENSAGRFLVFDNFPQSGIINHELYKGNLPYINYFFLSYLLNQNIKNILMLGMGTGRIAGNFAKLLPELENIDIIEIDPKVLSIAKQYFEFKENPKIKVHIQDAINFIKNTKSKYDYIILDITSGSGVPFAFHTEEFLNQLSSLLTEKGILVSNVVSSYEFNSDENVIFKSILKTYKNVFNDVMVIPTIYGDHLMNNIIFDIEGKTFDLVNTLLFSSNDKITVSKEELINRAKELQQKSSIQDIEKLDKFAEDLLEEKITTDNFKSFRDEYKNDPKFNSNNIKNYLII